MHCTVVNRPTRLVQRMYITGTGIRNQPVSYGLRQPRTDLSLKADSHLSSEIYVLTSGMYFPLARSMDVMGVMV